SHRWITILIAFALAGCIGGGEALPGPDARWGVTPSACETDADCENAADGTGVCCHYRMRVCVRGVPGGGTCWADTRWDYPEWCPEQRGGAPAEHVPCTTAADCPVLMELPGSQGTCCHELEGVCVRGFEYAGMCHENTHWAYPDWCPVAPPGL